MTRAAERELDYIDVATAGTLYGLFRERVRRSPGAEAYRFYDPDAGAWRRTTWADMAGFVGRWQAALAAEGLEPGDRVALMLANCREWVIFDQAALGLGLVVVPLYNDDRADSVAYILEDSGARLLLVEGREQWDRLAELPGQLDQVERIVSLHDMGGVGDDRVVPATRWLPPAPAEPRPDTADPEALATIVYTSGTTGRPKGVMLSHRSLLTNARNGLRTTPVHPGDLFLSFLPLSHTLERTVGYYIPMMAGCPVAHTRSLEHLGEDLRTLRPTLLVSVPRIFERVYNRFQEQLEEGSAVARWLFRTAVAAGWRRFLWRQGRARWSPLLLAHPLLHALVGRKVLARLGGRVRFAISGGAALPEPVGRTFIALGLPVLQGYGLTEAGPVISVNRLEDNDPASVGIPLPDTEVTTGEQDELLARSPSLMMGYWGDPEATAQRLTPDGWLRTGDQARIADGRVYITGRLKEIIVLSNGEKVPPEDMESAIALDPVFDQALVMGEHRPYLSALVVVDPEHWREIAGERCPRPAEDVLEDSECQQLLLDRLGQDLREFPGYARIRRAAVCEEPWTVDNGLMTPTLKPRRQHILDHFADKVAAVYAGHGGPGAAESGTRPASQERTEA